MENRKTSTNFKCQNEHSCTPTFVQKFTTYAKIKKKKKTKSEIRNEKL